MNDLLFTWLCLYSVEMIIDLFYTWHCLYSVEMIIDLFNTWLCLYSVEMIAIPDYPLGAMENWGLITYRETAMLYNKEISSEASRQRVTQVITHELSHQVRG